MEFVGVIQPHAAIFISRIERYTSCSRSRDSEASAVGAATQVVDRDSKLTYEIKVVFVLTEWLHRSPKFH